MKIHLDELELMQAAQISVSGDVDPRVQQHLSACNECRAALTEVTALRAHLNEAVDTASNQPDEFWHRQQAAIRTRIAASQAATQNEGARAGRGFLAALATAGVATALLAGTVAWNVIHRAPNSNSPNAVNHQVVQPVIHNSGQGVTDSDHEMLVAIEQELDGGAPDALEPAMGLVSEVSKAHATLRTTPKKIQGTKPQLNRN